MKNIAFFALVVLISSVFAEDTVKWAGTTEGAVTWAVPYLGDSSCTSDSTTQAPYVNFTVTFATDGVREVAAMAENDFKTTIRVYIYTGSSANTAAPCTNLYTTQGSIGKVLNLGGGGPVLDDVVFFSAGTYTFIVSSSDTTSGLFAVNIIPVIGGGSTSGGAYWYPAYDDGAGGCITDDYTAAYSTFTWTQSTSGYFDLYALFANNSLIEFESYIVLYQGVPATGGLAIDPCNNTLTGATVVSWNDADTFGTFIPYQWLTAGWNYTLVFSGDEDETAYYGVQVIPTRIRFFQTTPFVQPDRDLSDDTDCVVSEDYTAASWDTTIFTAEQRAYLLDTAYPPYPYTYLDTFSFLYSGLNTAVPPATCPLGESLVSYGDTGDVTPVFAVTEIGVNYTVVVSTYAGVLVTNGSSYAYVLYLFTGEPIGNLPTPTTAAASTSSAAASTSSAAASTTSTTSSTSAAAAASSSSSGATSTSAAAAATSSSSGAKTTSTTATPAPTSTTATAKATTTSSSSSSAKSATTSTSNEPSTTSSASSVIASVISMGAILFVLF